MFFLIGLTPYPGLCRPYRTEYYFCIKPEDLSQKFGGFGNNMYLCSDFQKIDKDYGEYISEIQEG